MKKTVGIEYLVARTNTMLANPNLPQEYKQGAISLLEIALHETGRYSGFRYLNMYQEGDTWKWPKEYDREYFVKGV